MRQRPEGALPPEAFVEIWQSSESLDEVARRTGVNKNACRTRAHRYRKQGVPLKQLKLRSIELIDWQRLAEYAKSVAQSSKATVGGQGRTKSSKHVG